MIFFAVISNAVSFDVDQLEVSVRNAEVCWRSPETTWRINIQELTEGGWTTLHTTSEIEGCWTNAGCEGRTIRLTAEDVSGETAISTALAVAGRPVASFTEDNVYVDCVLGQEYQVMDLLGRELRTGEMTLDGISLAGLMSGYYLVRVGEHSYKFSRN